MDPIPVKHSDGNQYFTLDGESTDYKLLDFWAWAFSDVLNNTTRGMVAEFIVATALGLDINKPRDGWAKYDLKYRNHGIEVKSASYHQRWFQKELSRISFRCPKTKAWDANTNKQDNVAKRHADIYVLCLLAEKVRNKVEPLKLDQWSFWIIETEFLNERIRSQHSITHSSLITEVGEPVCYTEIKQTVDGVIEKKESVK